MTAQLVTASDRRHLRFELYDRELADIFAVQDIALAIAAGRSEHTTWRNANKFRKRMRERFCGPPAESQEVK